MKKYKSVRVRIRIASTKWIKEFYEFITYNKSLSHTMHNHWFFEIHNKVYVQ